MDDFGIFTTNYENIFFGQYDLGHKHVIGPNPPAVCRFCEKSPPEVTFRTEAHAIPELLGNRQLVVTDECDACNALFARSIEDHLGKFTKPYRTIGQVRGKSGIPSYKSPKHLSRIDFRSTDGIVIQNHPDDPIAEFIEEENRIRMSFVIERHIPSAVYKALVKIALSIMPATELQNFTHAKRWIRHEDHTKHLLAPLKLQLYFVPGPKPHVGTSIMLLKKNSSSIVEALPHYFLLLAFGNLQYQIMIPSIFDNRGDGQDIAFTVPRFPSAFGADWPYGLPSPAIIDLSSGEVTEPRLTTISLHYSSIEEI